MTTNKTKKNPFTVARNRASIKTIGDTIEALVDAFSGEGSGDTFGAYILERAAEQVKARLPERQREYDEIMARVDAYRAERDNLSTQPRDNSGRWVSEVVQHN